MVERIRALCDRYHTNFSSIEKELGFGNGSLEKTSEKTQCGRIYSIATRFDVSMEYLLTGKEAPRLSAEEEDLIRKFRLLNKEGMNLLIMQADLLCDSGKYGKGNELIENVSA